MASDDGPVLIGGVLRAGLGLAKLSFSVAGFFFRAWLAVMRVVWRQAHFAVGAALAVVAGTALALLLDWSVPFAVTLLTVTNWWLFLPTSDLVWMARRGYVSPAYVRLALCSLASAVGVDEAVEKRETEIEARLAAKLERFRESYETKKRERKGRSTANERWTADAMPTEPARMSIQSETNEEDEDDAMNEDEDVNDASCENSSSDSDDDDFDAAKKKAKRRAKKLRALRISRRFVKTPIRSVLRHILRFNGLVPFENETEEQALRRQNGDAEYYFLGAAYSRGDGDVSGGDDGGGAAAFDGKRLHTNKPKKNIPKRALPEPSLWPHRPVFVRFSPRDNGTQKALAGWATPWGPETGAIGEKTPPTNAVANCPVNTETSMAFESELFVGTIVCRFKGITCPKNKAACKTKDDFFKKKRCTFQVLVQGKFKETVRADLILTGGEFHKPFTERPPNYLVSAGCKFFAALTPGLELDLLCDEPYYTATLGGTVTTLSVDSEGDAPDPLSDVKERNGRMGGAFSSTTRSGAKEQTKYLSADSPESAETDPTNTEAVVRGAESPTETTTDTKPSKNDFSSGGVSIARRCRVLGDPATAKDYYYNTEDVYTFDYFQSVLLFDSYCLDIGIVKLKLDRHVDGQPLGIMAKHKDGRYVYNFEIFHECLLPKTEQGVEKVGKA